MGGTTAKICLIDDFAPQASRSFEVARVGRFKKGSGLPLRIPVIDMVEIGAGGGSLAHVDALGRIAVGPESAGADPGPACYGRGGARPAVTDANLLLGRYDPDTLRWRQPGARRRRRGDGAASMRSAARSAWTTGMAALGVIEMVDENMANAARVHAVESGKTCEGRTLIAFGGGGPVHGARIAEKIGIARVLVPSGAGVGSAIGFLRAPVGYEVVRSLYQRLGSLDLDAVNALLAAMAEEAASVVARGSFGAETEERRLAYMRYVGQGHEIAVPLPVRPLDSGRRGGDPRCLRRRIYQVLRSPRARLGSRGDEFRRHIGDPAAAPAAATIRAVRLARRTRPYPEGARHGDRRGRGLGDLRPREPRPGRQLRRPGDRRRSGDIHPARRRLAGPRHGGGPHRTDPVG